MTDHATQAQNQKVPDSVEAAMREFSASLTAAANAAGPQIGMDGVMLHLAAFVVSLIEMQPDHHAACKSFCADMNLALGGVEMCARSKPN